MKSHNNNKNISDEMVTSRDRVCYLMNKIIHIFVQGSDLHVTILQ